MLSFETVLLYLRLSLLWGEFKYELRSIRAQDHMYRRLVIARSNAFNDSMDREQTHCAGHTSPDYLSQVTPERRLGTV